MILGEAPGATEDADGLAFVGRSGKLLDRLLGEIGLAGKVYISNAVKCRPPNNRKPTQQELDSCNQWLQIELAGKDIVAALGRTAQMALLGRHWQWSTKNTLYSFWGRYVDCLAVWHPSFILRNPQLYDQWKEQWNNIKP